MRSSSCWITTRWVQASNLPWCSCAELCRNILLVFQSEHFSFLGVNNQSNLSDMRCRTTFYTALGRLLMVDLGKCNLLNMFYLWMELWVLNSKYDGSRGQHSLVHHGSCCLHMINAESSENVCVQARTRTSSNSSCCLWQRRSKPWRRCSAQTPLTSKKPRSHHHITASVPLWDLLVLIVKCICYL